MKIVKIILKAIIGIYVCFSVALTTLTLMSYKVGWIKCQKCECGGLRMTAHGPLK